MAKKKANDDALLQLIRDGNSPAEAVRWLGVGRAAVSKLLNANPITVRVHYSPLSRFFPLLVAASGCRFAGPNLFMIEC
ncbi:MAG: hypothetical protein ABSF90_08105 [Syntrophobacteraceae bacterium]|jgi:hypothetical protein